MEGPPSLNSHARLVREVTEPPSGTLQTIEHTFDADDCRVGYVEELVFDEQTERELGTFTIGEPDGTPEALATITYTCP